MKSNTENFSKFTVYMMIGLPGSGKSTWAREHLSSYGYVSRDSIRDYYLGSNTDPKDYFKYEKQVFDSFVDTCAESCRNLGYCVADATHLNKASRNKFFRAFDNYGMKDKYKIIYVFMDTCIAKCLQRNAMRSGRQKVPDSVIQEMAQSITCPSAAENSAAKEVWLIRG